VLIKKATADSGRKEQGRGSEHPPSSAFVPLREEADRVLWVEPALGDEILDVSVAEREAQVEPHAG
jgi:hypothetical protein